MNGIYEPLTALVSYQQLMENIENNVSPLLALGATDPGQPHLIGACADRLKRPVFIICENEKKAKEMYNDLRFYMKEKVYLYPSKDFIFYSADVHSLDIVKQRFFVMEKMISEDFSAIVAPFESLIDKFVPKAIFESHILSIQEGDTVHTDILLKKLAFMGYENRDPVESAGQFTMRGGILDIFPINEDNGIRVEFWGDTVDSIRILDAMTQRSIERSGHATIFPMRELVYDENLVALAAEKFEKEYIRCKTNFQNNHMSEELINLNETVGEAIEKIKTQKTFSGVEKYIHYFYDNTVSIFSYLPSNTLVFVSNPDRVAQHTKQLYYEYDESIMNRIAKGYMLPDAANIIFRREEIAHDAARYNTIYLSYLAYSENDYTAKETVQFAIKPTIFAKQKFDYVKNELLQLKQKNYKILVLAGPTTRCERLSKELTQSGIENAFIPDLDNIHIQPQQIVISRGNLSEGLEYPESKFIIISDQEMIMEKGSPRKKKRGTRIENFTDLKIGDYIVHDNHGIGKYEGIEKIITDRVVRDYLKISYSDGGSLYVPTNQLDMLQKYIGGEANIKLNKLGGHDWGKAKAKAKLAVEAIAKDLIDLYAKRQSEKGFVYSKDTIWQREFEDLFPYDETDDQLVAIEDVKRDMESDKIMDRLICGDVGYGKTEVAIRAAFKAVQDGKQVAYLIPTTILAQQHYKNFKDRMQDFPIQIEMLSRFRTSKQQKETLANLKNGSCDIVIGTHRLLSKDIVFKNLGIIIVDEEQRFGVTHKEKLKKLKESVDVLTLTATPIPRTLHMSLTGIRDMSVLEEPPGERRPVQTYVLEYNPEFIRDAINRELARGGQVYYLHNRVKNISEAAARVKALVPDATVAYAHGQMTERELENIMIDFVGGELDVLVCTTIIETGLDIANVNTIIINDADKMGLSQLYQLRGRVGRSNKIAYAYLMYRKNKVLMETAEKRLQTIKEFTEFGSGFKIAMRDLEIRGAGSLLGAKQHGHIEAVGYDMYCKLLEETVLSLSGAPKKQKLETQIDIRVSAYIPDFYIANEEQKLIMYKKIASIENEENYSDLTDELIDRFGDIPQSVINLLDIGLMKAIAVSLQMTSIIQKGALTVFTFLNETDINMNAVAQAVKENQGTLMFTSSKNPYLTYKSDGNLTNIKSLLQRLNHLNLEVK